MQESIKELNNKKMVIIGGGPAGLTAAYQLSKLGVESIVLEKDQVVGGISRTVNYKNYLFDVGGHRFFTKIKAVEDIWKEVLAKDLLHCKRMSRIYYNKKFFFYPLRPINALSGLGIWNSTMIILSYLYSRIFPYKDEMTFEQWVTNRFGKRLYNTFFKTYTEKVWGISCNEIRAEWAAQRIKGLSLLSAIKDALIKQNKSRKGRVITKTLIDSFDYPKLGPGMMWQAVSKIIQGNGSRICLGNEVEAILWEKTMYSNNVIKYGNYTLRITNGDIIDEFTQTPIKYNVDTTYIYKRINSITNLFGFPGYFGIILILICAAVIIIIFLIIRSRRSRQVTWS